jgi:hypothetical protein
MYFSGQGRLYYGVRNASGGPEHLIAFGNVPKLETSIDVTKFEHKESMSGNRAIDLTIVKEKKGTFSFTLEDITLSNLALGFWGTAEDIAADTATSVDIVAKLGKRVPIRGFMNLSNIVVKDEDTGLVTYEFGNSVDAVGSKNGYYDATYGVIVVFPTATQTARSAAANITDNEVLTVTFDNAAASRMRALTETSMERFLRFEGLNTVDGEEVMIEIPKASIDPLTGLGLINEELGSFDLTGTILYDELQTTGSKFLDIYYPSALPT